MSGDAANAAVGETGPPPPPGAPLPVADIPSLIGKSELAVTLIAEPRICEMPGVMTWKRQSNETCTRSPMSVAVPLPLTSMNVGYGAVTRTVCVAGSQSRQFVARALVVTSTWYSSSVSASPASSFTALLAAKFAASRAMFCELTHPGVEAPEVNSHEHDQQEDGQDDRELDQRLPMRIETRA